MDEFRTYLMSMAPPERAVFAKRVGMSVGHLHNVAYGNKPATAELAISVERESGGKVRFECMCPSIDVSHMRARL